MGRATMLRTPQFPEELYRHNGPFSGPKSINKRGVYPEY
jgi:hypothetical protein